MKRRKASPAGQDQGASHPLRLSQAELAAILQDVLGGQRLPESSLLADLELKEGDLERARRRLIKSGVLLAGSDGEPPVLEPGLWPMLSAALYPMTLGVLQVTGPGRPTATLYISWAAGKEIVFNRVDSAGEHRIESLATAEAVVDMILSECEMSRDGSAASDSTGARKAKRPPAKIDPEEVAREATLRALLLVVSGASTPRREAQAVSWLVSRGTPWLVVGAESRAAVFQTTHAELHAFLLALAQRAGESGQAGASSA